MNNHRLDLSLDNEKLFNDLTQELKEYVLKYNLHALILGVSGGIDSAVCAAICYNVVEEILDDKPNYNIKLIGRSLPLLNTQKECNNANLVGEAFCDDYEEMHLYNLYKEAAEIIPEKAPTKLQLGNIQARLRMIYLYNLATENNGIVVDPLNYTEYMTGFWTICGDVGDIHPIWQLYKSEVYNLASYLATSYYADRPKVEALQAAIEITPTDGLGISESDMEQFKCENYLELDEIISDLEHKFFNSEYILNLIEKFGSDKVLHVRNLINRSSFKRYPMKMKFQISYL